MDILTYAKLYKQFITTKDCDEGLLVALRDELTRNGEYKRLIAVEKTVDYESFGGGEELMRFINATKTVLIKTDHTNIEAWRKANPSDLYRCDSSKIWDNLTAATLEKYTNDYLKEVEG